MIDSYEEHNAHMISNSIMNSVRQGNNSLRYTQNLGNRKAISWSAKDVMPSSTKFNNMGNQDKVTARKHTVVIHN